jgi:Cof subfamily protein (haloacid dehalogenase superfamily)
MYKAAFLDMDGTLLRSDHSVSEQTVGTIRGLTARGIPVVLVSARPLNAILPTFQHLGLPDDSPVITLNGGYVVQSAQPLLDIRIDLEMTAEVTALVRPFHGTIAYYLQRNWYAEINDAWTDHEQKIMDVDLGVAPIAKLLEDWSVRETGPNKMMVMSEPDNISAIQKHLRSVFVGRLNIYPSKPTFLEVMDIRASKSNAVKFVSERLGIHRSQVIAIGDNYNDEGMISWAGMGIAMGNAPEDVKATARYVTDTNNEDGVRKALEKFF